MADEPAGRTSLGVLHEILNNLGDSNTYLTVVEALEALLNVLGSGGIGQAVSDWLEAHPEATTTVQNGSITLLKLANDVKSAIDGKAASSDLQALANDLEALAQAVAEKADASDLDDKADIDGYYAAMTVGAADNLTGHDDGVSGQYLYRTAGGDEDIADGVANIQSIKGDTIVWNQLVNTTSGSGTELDGAVSYVKSATDGSYVFNGTVGEGTVRYIIFATGIPITTGHKYLLDKHNDNLRYYMNVNGSYNHITNVASIFTAGANSANTQIILVVPNEGYTFDNYRVVPQLFDLTQMFGEGSEPSTVAEFEALFPKAYYPYSEPTLLSVNMEGIETVGFNQWDEEWEQGALDAEGQPASGVSIRSKNFIPVLPSTAYYVAGLTSGVLRPFYYDSEKAFISIGYWVGGTSNNPFTIPSTARYMKFAMASSYGSTYNNDICINLSWSGYRDGEYEEYWNFQREIPAGTYFPDGMRSAGSVSDELTPSKAITRVGAVDLGALTWTRAADTSGHPYFYVSLYGYPSPAVQPAASLPNAFCAIYQRAKFEDLYNDYTNVPDGSIGLTNGTANNTVYIKDDATATAAALKTKLSGVILYYELATPTTTEIDPPLNLSYKVSDFGTEKVMVDEEADAPQSAPPIIQTVYGLNAVDTLRRLPTEYQSHDSMGQFTAALESSLGIDITETWDENDQRYEYTIGGLEVGTDEIEDDSIPDAKLAQTGGVLSAVETIRSKQVAAVADVIYPNGNVFVSSVNGSTPNRIRAKRMWLDAGSLVELVDQSGIYMGVDGFSTFYGAWENPYASVPPSSQYGTFTSGWIKTPYVVPTSAFVLISVRKDDNSVFTSVSEMDGLIRVTKSKFAPPLSLDAIAQRKTRSSLDMFGLHFGSASLYNGDAIASQSRVSTPIAVACNSSILFVAKSGFKFGIHTFINGSFSADSGWQTSYRVPAGTTFKMVIARNVSPESTDPADVDLFTSSVMAYDEVQQALGPMPEQARRLPRNNWITSAHRGFVPAGSGLHENTLAAFYEAAMHGAEMIELDARLTSDGVLVSNHDATVTGVDSQGQTVTYTIADETAETICSVILSQDNVYGTQYVPTLEQVLDLAYKTGMDVNIDLKNGYYAAEQAARAVWKCGMRGHVVYALNGSGMQSINKIIELDPHARFIDTPENFNATTLAELEDYESRCYAYLTPSAAQADINAVKESGCMLALISLHSANFANAIKYRPEMCEFPHTSDFYAIETGWYGKSTLYAVDA